MGVRNLLSWYYDKINKVIDSGSKMPSYPSCRPHRYILICKATKNVTTKGLEKKLLTDHGIKIKKDKNLPF